MAPSAFRPWLDERVLEEDSDVLVVDKPSGIPVHGGDEKLSADVVSRLRERLTSAGQQPYLGVHQRLDLGTSGVLLFVRRAALNAAVARDFEEGAVKKEYVALVALAARSPLRHRDRLTLAHRLVHERGVTRVVQRGGQLCSSECRVLARRGERALIELRPTTGRTHQLRVQLAEVHAPIVGDATYGGVRAPRLFLHARSLFMPSLERRFVTEPPPVFGRALEGDSSELGEPLELRARLRDAACLRYPLLRRTAALRWVNGWGDELPGVVVDWYDGYTTLSVTSEPASARASEIAEGLMSLGARSVYLKRRPRADLRRADVSELAPPLPVAGEPQPSPLVLRECSWQLQIALGDGFSTGLFVDQRDNRARLFEGARGLTVLNLFAYAGSFSVAAAMGGARRVTTVDLSNRAIERARENFVCNGLDVNAHAFIREDAVKFLQRAAGRGERFDWIVLDPPSFSSRAGASVLRVDKDYERLARLCLTVLAPGGRLLAVTNHRKTTPSALRRLLLQTARALDRSVAQAKELAPGLDCPDGPDGPEPSKAVLLTLQ